MNGSPRAFVAVALAGLLCVVAARPLQAQILSVGSRSYGPTLSLKQSTARNRLVFVTTASTHTAATGLTLTITVSKNGGAFASITPTVTELGNGWYSLALTSSHTNTLGDLAYHITASGADALDFADQVVLSTGQQAMTASTPVVIASDQSAVPVTEASGAAIKTAVETIDNFISGSRGLVTEDNSAAIAASASVLDDWDESDRAKVNPIVGQAGVAAGAGAVGATVQRMTHASDDPAVTTLGATTDAATGDATGTINGHLREIAKYSSLSPTVQPGNTPNTTPWLFSLYDAAGNARGANVDASNRLQITIGDGASVTLGSKADAKSTATDTTSISIMQVLKQISASVQAPASTAVTNAGTFAVQAAGDVAHDAADSGNPVKVGFKASSAEPAAVTNADRANGYSDLAGRQVVAPFSNNENYVSGAITSAMTGTTSTSLVAAPASGLRNYITACTVSNAHATVGTDVVLQDGSGGTTLWTFPAGTNYGGTAQAFPVPLRQPTTATALFAANVTTGASVKISCNGYKGY